MKHEIIVNKDICSNVIIFNSSCNDIGYIARTNTVGKEFDMVKRYINFLLQKYSKMKTKKAAIFVEPQLETGYPDIVVVEYYSMPNLSWNKYRNSLGSTDLKILFYVQNNKNLSVEKISNTLGFSLDTVKKSVRRLSSCGLIYLSKHKTYVRNVRLNKYCRVHKVIAIEAKIDKWNEAIRQANNNIWFSTESYVLMNKDSCSSTITETCQNLGIGIILVNGKIETILKSSKRSFPVSYASLQFNEWILRNMNKKE